MPQQAKAKSSPLLGMPFPCLEQDAIIASTLAGFCFRQNRAFPENFVALTSICALPKKRFASRNRLMKVAVPDIGYMN